MKKLLSLGRSLRETGFRATARYYRRRALEMLQEHLDARFDRRYRVDTAGVINLGDLDIRSDHTAEATWYEPTPAIVIRQLIEALGIRYEDYTFIDCGSGKGRPLLIASEYPFARVVGIEFSPDLHAIAERNIGTYRNRSQRCTDVRSVCEDALDFEWPAVPLVVFLFSPFRPPLFEKILGRILDSIRAHPRSVYVVYYGSMRACIDMLRRCGLECREVGVRRTLASKSNERVGLILNNKNI